MIRALWLLVKVGIFVSLVIWIADRPGYVSIDWLNYKIKFHVGLFLLIILGVVMLGMAIFGIVKGVLDLPKTWGRYRDFTNKDKGLRALTLGLSAVAAGDAKAANYQSYRASKYLQDDQPLKTLLAAQAARLEGRELDASNHFIALMQDKEASFLGVRGLLQIALDSNDVNGALELSKRALEAYPKQPWILRIAYDLQLKAHHWDDAVKTLYVAEKAEVFHAQKALSDRVAILLARAEQAKVQGQEEHYFRYLQKAYQYDYAFAPSVERLALMYLERNKTKAAIAVLEKAWKTNPHPSLLPLWDRLCPPPRTTGKSEPVRVKWYERLLKLNPDNVVSLQAIAAVCMGEQLWGEARKYLERAEAIAPSDTLYKLWAQLEDKATHDQSAVMEYLKKAADAPKEKVWVCTETGRVYDRWASVSDLGYFNSIVWDYADSRRQSIISLSGQSQDIPALLSQKY